MFYGEIEMDNWRLLFDWLQGSNLNPLDVFAILKTYEDKQRAPAPEPADPNQLCLPLMYSA